MVYMPEHFTENDVAAMHDVIRTSPLGTIVTLGDDGLEANHIPFVLDPTHGNYGRLLGHVARRNDLWRYHRPEIDALVIFQVADAYISPNWYASKQETGEAVPTWNYSVVHVYGRLIAHDDPKWVRGQAGMLTKIHEATQPHPWKMADAPQEYTAQRLTEIVGIEIPISRLIGKTKASQNRTESDRRGVADALTASGNQQMAELVARFIPDETS